MSSHIEHGNNLSWLQNLEKAVLDIFPEYKNVKYDALSGGFIHIDLNSVEKKKNKELNPYNIIHSDFENQAILHNPYDVSYIDLAKDYTIEENVEICIRKVQIQLRNEKYQEARYELNSYLDFIGERSNLDYNILILEMLISSKAKTLEYFL